MVTFEGKLAIGLLLPNATLAPAGPAGPLRVTVPVEESPPVTVIGAKLKELRVAELTFRNPVSLDPSDEAVTVATVFEATGIVLITKLADVSPPSTTTAPGTIVEGSPLFSVTTFPDGGAGADRVTVPSDEVPPSTLVGLIERPFTGIVPPFVPIAYRLLSSDPM